MTESQPSINYPLLNDVYTTPPGGALADSASAPEVDSESAARERMYAQSCGVCKSTSVALPGFAYAVLSCQHRVHVTCLLGKHGLAQSENRIGGASICAHCYDIATRTGGTLAQDDPDIDLDKCARELHQMHIQQSSVDTEAIMRAGVSDEILRDITGERSASSVLGVGRVLPSPQKIIGLFRSQADVSAADDDVDESAVAAAAAAAAPSLPRGDALVEYLNAKRPPRTLDAILNTFRVNLAHLFVAGITTIDQLKAIGFDVRRHLNVDFRPVLPVYLLATAYDLSYDRHMRGVVTPAQIAQMHLSKREMRLLGVTVSKLIETRQCTKQTLLDIGMRPSHMIKYMQLEQAHLEVLHFTAADFERNELWKQDLHSNAQVRELASRLPPAASAAAATQKKKK